MADTATQNKNGSPLSELRMLQLASPSLPTGGFAYSQGLEWAVEAGWVNNELDCESWLSGLMRWVMAQLDVPVLTRCYQAWPAESGRLEVWDHFLLASRETRELRREELDRGRMLMRCLEQINGDNTKAAYRPLSFVCAYSLASWSFHLGPRSAAHAYLWSWLESQIMAGIRLIPLGQSQGQRILFRLAEKIPEAFDAALRLEDHDVGASAPALALASALHETKYTRLFRS